MTAPETDQKAPEPAPAAEPTPTEPGQTEIPIKPTEGPSPEDELPEWAKAKLKKANNEAQSLRNRLKEQEPLVTAAQEAERAKMSELDRANADITALNQQLAQRDLELLQARYQIPDDFVEFLMTEGTFEEKEARAKKVGEMVQAKNGTQDRPPSDRPVESLKPGASPSTPPVEDNSYPAAWTPPHIRNQSQ